MPHDPLHAPAAAPRPTGFEHARTSELVAIVARAAVKAVHNDQAERAALELDRRIPPPI